MKKKGRSGCVYVLTNEAMPCVVKIGRSFAGAEIRCWQINQSGCHITPFEVAWSADFSDCVRVEGEAHKSLQHRRLKHNLELFAVSVEEAVSAIVSAETTIKPKSRFVTPQREGPPRVSQRSKRLRISSLYEWLKDNHAAISSLLSEQENVFSSSPVYETLLDEWLSALPEDYRGRRCSSLGLYMEWQRVDREMQFQARSNKMHLLEASDE